MGLGLHYVLLNIVFLRPQGMGEFLYAAFRGASAGEQALAVGIVILGAFVIRHITQGMLRWILVRVDYFKKEYKTQ